MELRAVDLFCGIGGFAYGMQQAGIRIIRALDREEAVLEMHNTNIKPLTATRSFGRRLPPGWNNPEPASEGPFRRGDIHGSRKVAHAFDLAAVLDIAPEVALDQPDVIFGGPPCQAFSNAGRKKGDEDERSRLTEAFAIVVAAARPKYFVMENVKGLRDTETYRRAMAIFRRAGYGISQNVVDASHYGTPQRRQRLIVAGCLGETDGWFNAYLDQYRTAEPMTVRQAMGEDFGTRLADFLIAEDCGDVVRKAEQSDYNGYRLRERDLQRIANADPDARFYFSVAGGMQSAFIRPVDRPADTIISSTLKVLPKTYRPIEGDPVDLRLLHRPTFQEYARIFGFPEDWDWGDYPASKRNLMLANAVPPRLALAIGKGLQDHHRQKSPEIPIEVSERLDHSWKVTPRFLNRYRKWLTVGKGLSANAVRQQIADCRAAKALVASRGLAGAKDELQALDLIFATSHQDISATRKSHLRRSLSLLAEFEFYREVVREGVLFPDDDVAYANGDFHWMFCSKKHAAYEAEAEAAQNEEGQREAAEFWTRHKPEDFDNLNGFARLNLPPRPNDGPPPAE